MSYATQRKEARDFAARMSALGFTVYLAEQGHYGFLTDETESRVLGFSFTGVCSSLSGNYGPPSSESGTGWGLAQSPGDLRTADDVREALYAIPPAYCGRGWTHFTNVKQYMSRYGASSRYAKHGEG